MSNSSFTSKNFIIISTLECLISKEMNLIKVTLLQVLQAIRLVPACGEAIETDLSTDAKMSEKKKEEYDWVRSIYLYLVHVDQLL